MHYHWLRPAAALALIVAMRTAPAVPAAPAAQPEFVEAVEFPYYLYPRALWERELVWLKTVGIHTVEFSIPWNWHQIQPGDFDLTGRTSPRRDLAGFVRLLRKLELRGWVRPLPPVAGWVNGGTPASADAAARRAWLHELDNLLATQTVSHGGPIAYVEGRVLSIDAGAPPAPVAVIPATDSAALRLSREAIAARRGALLWTEVEDALYPAGWEANPGSLLHKGAVGMSGEEHPATAALRRDAALLRYWSPLLAHLQPVPLPKPLSGKLPAGVAAMELASPAASVVSIENRGSGAFQDDLRVLEPGSRRPLVIPGVKVRPGDSMWLPVSVSLGPGGLCRECSNFSGAEHIIYATAELLSIEFENGILAMEFAAPDGGEVVLQLAREPIGPFLAAGKPTKFDWDDKTLRARLPIPASQAPGNRVRIGIAMEEPETSAFFNEAHRLIIGQKNLISTVYSSADVANRSRLKLPPGFTATRKVKSPNEIDYEVTVPADALHGDWANLALEADGMLLGRARLQMFRPLSVHMTQAIPIHFGRQTELAVEPATAPAEPRAGSNLEIVLRNNAPAIQTFHIEASGEGLEFFPARTDISIGAVDERRISLRVFAGEGVSGLRDFRLRISGAVAADIPMRVLLLPRGRTVAWSADLDADGTHEWVLESHKVRAVFSSQDGGRWIEFTSKDSNLNFLPEQGAFAAPVPVEIRPISDGLVFIGKGWQRTVRLADNALTVEQTTTLPPDGLTPEKRESTSLSIERDSPARFVYRLN